MIVDTFLDDTCVAKRTAGKCCIYIISSSSIWEETWKPLYEDSFMIKKKKINLITCKLTYL